MKKSAIAAVVLAATAVPVVAQQMKAENQVKYRRAAYQLMNLNFGNLDAMAESKKPFNRDEAARNAEFVALLATVPKGFFGEGDNLLVGAGHEEHAPIDEAQVDQEKIVKQKR